MFYRLMYENYDFNTADYTHEPPVRVRTMNVPIDGVQTNFLYKLEHGVPFADDKTVNDMLYQEYHNTFAVYSSPIEMLQELQAAIIMNGDFWDKMWETTQYDYNPIENYNMIEEEQEARCGESQARSTQTTNTNNTDTGRRYGYNESTPADVQQETAHGETVAGNSAQDRSRTKGQRELTRHGNIGVTTTQQMIESQRDVILAILRKYVDSFRPYFIIM